MPYFLSWRYDWDNNSNLKYKRSAIDVICTWSPLQKRKRKSCLHQSLYPKRYFFLHLSSHPKEKRKKREFTPVLTQTHYINKEQPSLQWHILKIHRLHQWPHRPIRSEGIRVATGDFLRRVLPLENRHDAQENEEVGGGKQSLVGDHARGESCTGGAELDMRG